jgi:hypothetical protein
MADPRNVAHDKKVIQEKKQAGEDLESGAAHVPQPGKKTAAAPGAKAADAEDTTAAEGHPPRSEA